MIVTKIYLESAISPKRSRALGAVLIANVGGDAKSGDYEVQAMRPGGRLRSARVTKFPRKQKSALELLRRCLNALHDNGDLP